MQLLLVLLIPVIAAALPDPGTLATVRRRRRLGFAAGALLLLLAVAQPYYTDWQRETRGKAASQVLQALHQAEERYREAHGAYARLDQLRAAGDSPVAEGGSLHGYTFASTAGPLRYSIIARPLWRGESYTMDESGMINRPARLRKQLTPEERLIEARAAAKARPRDAAAWVSLAEARIGTKHYAEALAAARRAASLNRAAATPALRDALLLHGSDLLTAGKAREALPLFLESARLGKGDPDALAFAGDAYDALGRKEDALGLYRRAAQSGVTCARAWYGMARILDGRGRREEAARAYLRVVDIGDEAYVPDEWASESMAALDRLRGGKR